MVLNLCKIHVENKAFQQGSPYFSSVLGLKIRTVSVVALVYDVVTLLLCVTDRKP